MSADPENRDHGMRATPTKGAALPKTAFGGSLSMEEFSRPALFQAGWRKLSDETRRSLISELTETAAYFPSL